MEQGRLPIENGNWGGASLSAIHAVLESAYEVLVQAFDKHPDAPIHVAWWNQSPQVFYDHRPYQIRISARDTYWCQYVYQFSHELCHVMTNFERRREHKHKWFEEGLCELASLFVLHRLADSWKNHPPICVVDAEAFAPNFRTYAEEIEQGHRQPEDGDFRVWLTDNLGRLEKDPCIRELNRTLAIALLDRFLEDPSLWRDCGRLNFWDANVDETFEGYLEAWAEHLQAQGMSPRVPNLVEGLFISAQSTMRD